MKVKGGPNKACAACKFQRRRCPLECSLAPFFPADQPKIFHNVHRLFGVSKVIKILKKLHNHDQKVDAMKSIIYESNVRERFPVNGCFGIITQLHQQLQHATEELHYVQAQLAACTADNSPSSQFINSYDLVSENQSSQLINSYDFVSENDGGFYAESGDTTKPLFNVTNYNSDVICDNKPLEIQPELGDSSHGLIHIKHLEEAPDQDYNYMNFYAIDDDQSKEACESSSESSSKNTRLQQFQIGAKNELRSAAACFSLMSLN